MFASNILLIIELPAIEAARPALKPDKKKTNKYEKINNFGLLNRETYIVII